MKICGECGLFCSCGALWPWGLCLPAGDRLVEAAAAACVCWEVDLRGADQSDGEREKFESSQVLKCESGEAGDEGAERGNGEGAMGAADPDGAKGVRKPESPRAAGVRQRARFRQTELF